MFLLLIYILLLHSVNTVSSSNPTFIPEYGTTFHTTGSLSLQPKANLILNIPAPPIFNQSSWQDPCDSEAYRNTLKQATARHNYPIDSLRHINEILQPLKSICYMFSQIKRSFDALLQVQELESFRLGNDFEFLDHPTNLIPAQPQNHTRKRRSIGSTLRSWFNIGSLSEQNKLKSQLQSIGLKTLQQDRVLKDLTYVTKVHEQYLHAPLYMYMYILLYVGTLF